MRIHYILHADFERPGFIEVWAREKNFTQTFTRSFAGEMLPAIEQFDLLVVMGGPQDATPTPATPFLADEIALIGKAGAAGMPILGICLGAQLIAESFGALTERSPHKEIGIYPIELNEAGRADPILRGLPSSFSVMHWHGDMPGLPRDAVVLAHSVGCPRQIVRFAPNIYGFQCHPEPSRSNIEAMLTNCAGDLAPARFVQTADELLGADIATMNAHMRQILDNFLTIARKSV